MTCSRTRFIVIRKVARSWLKGDLAHSLAGRGNEIGRLCVGDVWYSAETRLSLVEGYFFDKLFSRVTNDLENNTVRECGFEFWLDAP